MKRQVPDNPKYLIIGDGKLATHLKSYFSSLGSPYLQWSRNENSEEDIYIYGRDCHAVLLCINDDALESFYQQHQFAHDTWVHFSGVKDFPGALGFHPLMTFSSQAYPETLYGTIPFVGTPSREVFRLTFPQFENEYYAIKPEQKAMYHALCVLGGNGTVVLWDEIFSSLENSLGLPRKVIVPYFLRIFENVLQSREGRHTGPWFRNDGATIERNRQALPHKKLAKLYEAFHQLTLPEPTSTNEVAHEIHP